MPARLVGVRPCSLVQLACRRRAPNSKAHHLEVNLACGGLIFLDLLDGRDQAAIGGHAGQVRFRDDAAVDQLGHDVAALSATLLSEVLVRASASARRACFTPRLCTVII
jgi:hypothetical protein